jgi:hypothetical protein
MFKVSENIPFQVGGADIFRAVGEVKEITDPYPTNQKSACLFLAQLTFDNTKSAELVKWL